jgi:photosystem II stability/assembly factor-like uncharacterized protein
MLKFNRIITSSLIAVSLIIIAGLMATDEGPKPMPEPGFAPNNWMLAQRIYPHKEMKADFYEATREKTVEFGRKALKYKSGTLKWEFAGPVNVGGRITDVEMHHTDMQTIYACAASGGLYKSTDQGDSWRQIFENEYTLSTGDLGVAYSDKNILYLGTGEPNGGNGSVTYDGYGVFKSTNAGENWTHVGLENAGGIGRVEVNPEDPDIVFVACMGNLFSKNPERGIYRTKDGGETWENVLFISDSTGGIDLCIHPTNPDTIYATMWERVRHAEYRHYGGPTSGMYRSYDGGDTWDELTNGLPKGEISRIGLGMSMSNPEIIYAHYSNTDRQWIDCFKTTDGGDHWFATGSTNIEGNYWEGKIQVDPTNPDILWSMGVYMHKSIDGAQSWQTVSRSSSPHDYWVDNHGVYVHPQNPDMVITGNDGEVYISYDGTGHNNKVLTLPITQFYTVEVSPHNENHRYGGTQDRGTQGTKTGSFDDWSSINGGDGFIVRVDPSDDRYMYAASQRGGFVRSTNGGSSFRGARPSSSDRYNWKTPYIIDPTDPGTIYLGSQRVWKSTDRAVRWKRISNDLTNGAREWNYGTITTIAASAVNDKIIVAGTDDGNVWITTNGGDNFEWTKVSEDLPHRWVTCVATDHWDENTIYVSYSGIRYHDPVPHVFRSNDLGQTWADISSNLPDFPVNNIQVDPDNSGSYYVATDGGVFATYDYGESWELMGTGMPFLAVLDLKIHRPSRMLYAATFGRSQYRIPLQPASGRNDFSLDTETISVYPNPSQGQVNINISLENPSGVSLEIFDINGRMIKSIYKGALQTGSHQFIWSGSNDHGQRIPGNYICRLVTGKENLSRRIIISE